MSAPYYADDQVTLWHGDCREVTDWLAADVLLELANPAPTLPADQPLPCGHDQRTTT